MGPRSNAGAYHTCALVAAGAVKCWGGNSSGQLGDGTNTVSTTAVDVTGVVGATAIDAGVFHTCALVAGGTVKCWGDNFNGQLGDGTNTNSAIPVDVTGVAGATAVTAGALSHLRSDGRRDRQVLGRQRHRPAGRRRPTPPRSLPVDVTRVGDATAVAAGDWNTCALMAGGTVGCWGMNTDGQLGNGTQRRLEPRST